MRLMERVNAILGRPPPPGAAAPAVLVRLLRGVAAAGGRLDADGERLLAACEAVRTAVAAGSGAAAAYFRECLALVRAAQREGRPPPG